MEQEKCTGDFGITLRSLIILIFSDVCRPHADILSLANLLCIVESRLELLFEPEKIYRWIVV